MDFLKDKDKKTNWSESVRQSYEDEERIRKQHTHIFLKKESEFNQVARIIKRFQEYSSMEFDTLFKLYKLQNYQLTPSLFKGTSYKYGTLSAFLSFVRLATKDKIVYIGSNKPMLQIIYEFINPWKYE